MTTSSSSDSLLLLLVGVNRQAARVRVSGSSSSCGGRPHSDNWTLGRVVKLGRGRSSAGGAVR